MIERTMTYDEVAQMWRAICHGGAKLPFQGSTLERQRLGWQTADLSFYGGTLAQMTEHVDQGWLAPGMDLKPGKPQVERYRRRYDDMDGELDVDRALMGDDRYYVKRQPRVRQAGLQLNVQFNFLADTPASVLADYGQWVAELIAGLQGRSFDLQIDVFSQVNMAIKRQMQVVRTNIRVKRFGKRSSLKSWGALFSPTGYRNLGFCARMMACSEAKVMCANGMGSSIAPGWDVKLDGRELTITCHAGGSRFPRELMDAKLAGLSI
jgi:hypothetical protein